MKSTLVILTAVVSVLLAVTLSAAPSPGAGAPQRGGTLVVVAAERPDILDPSIHFSTLTDRISQNTHDSLVHMVDATTFVPGLAERWEISPDFKSYTFFLRKDVKFQDGTSFTADSVKATWDRTLDPTNRSSARQLFGPNPKIETLDPYTVRISFPDPYPQFFQQVALPQLAPNSPAAWQKLGRAYLNAPVGAGPFKVDGFMDENTLVLTRFDAYRWGPRYAKNKSNPYLDRIIFRFVREQGGRTLALQKKEVHVADEVSRQKMGTWKTPEFQLLTFSVPGLPQNWPFNMTRWPSNVLAVRQAASYAIDRERLIRLAFSGTTTVAYGPLTTNTVAFWPEARNYYRYDPQKAMQILAQAGFKRNPSTGILEQDGKPLRMRLVTNTSDDQVRAATVAQAMLRKVGIDLVVEAVATAVSFARYEANDYEMARHGLDTLDPGDLAFAYSSSQIHSPSVSNRGRLSNPEIDRLLERGRVLTDPEQRKQVYFQIQKILLDTANSLYTYAPNYFTVGLSCVHDFHWNAHGYTEFLDTWVDGDCRRIGN